MSQKVNIAIIPFVFLIIFTLTYCSSEDKTNLLTNDCDISKRSVEIPFPSNSTFQNFHHFSQICRMEDKEIYVGFSRKSNQLEWFDIETKEIAGLLSIPKIGPHKIPRVYGFYFHNPDSIFVAGLFRVIGLNIEGEVWFSEQINTPTSQLKGIDFEQQNIYNTPRNSAPLHYDAEENSLYFATKRGVSRFSDEFFEGSLLAKLNITNKEFTQLPIYYPEDMKGKLFPYHKPNFTILSDKIIYNFQGDARVYIYNKKNKKTESFLGKTNFLSTVKITPVTESIMQDDFAVRRHISENPQFLAVTYDKISKLYYKPTISPYLGDLTNDKVGQMGKVFVSVYDDKFQLIREDWHKDYRFTANLMTVKGLMLIPTPKLTVENAFKSIIYKVDCSN